VVILTGRGSVRDGHNHSDLAFWLRFLAETARPAWVGKDNDEKALSFRDREVEGIALSITAMSITAMSITARAVNSLLN
jgi:hypothetical protein